MSDPQKATTAQAAAEQTLEQPSLLDQIVEQGRLARDPASKERGKNLVKDFVAQVLDGAMTVSRDAEAMITARIAQIDHLVSIQLNEILHHTAFQKLEASWRGLKYLMDQSETSSMLKIKVLNCQQAGAASGLAASAGIRPERAVQESLRRRVRRFRRRALRCHDWRLRIRQGARRDRAAREDLQCGGGGARPVPHRNGMRRC